ncbi:MAG: carboxyltransferase domain-containing protein [Proteobacteria bacterium]|nr:carboxyltransferase domain-containing protein [Pseudomonadota bacterium]
MSEKPRILPAGDQAILVEFGGEINPTINRLVQAFTNRANQNRIPGMLFGLKTNRLFKQEDL